MAIFTGTAANNRIVGTSSADTIRGLDGNDELKGGGGADIINGGAGNDLITGGAGADTLTGGAGSDTFVFAPGCGMDVVTDFAANDVVRISTYTSAQSFVQSGANVVLTLSATDKITFSNASLAAVQAATHFAGGTTTTTTGATITGTAGWDTLNGTAGNDVIKGLAGYDVIHGGGGNDRIYGGLDGDQLFGGAGADTFVYTSLADGPPYGLMYYESDTIGDWQSIDKIDLSAIDANPALAGQQHFHFTGFTDGASIPANHAAGSLYILHGSGYWGIEGFTGGQYPSFYIGIEVSGSATVSGSNLLL